MNSEWSSMFKKFEKFFWQHSFLTIGDLGLTHYSGSLRAIVIAKHLL